MGINLEMYTGRTLEFSGQKRVEAIIQPSSASTHSMTLFPMIRADGTVWSQLCVIFYEPKGAPKVFNEQLAEYPNLKAAWTRSGKMTSEITLAYFRSIQNKFDKRNLVLLDSWSGYNSLLHDHGICNTFSFGVIPPKATPFLQPLDFYYNRQFKHFLKIFSNYVRRKQSEFILSSRTNIARTLSLIHDQFTAPRYKNMIRYAFYGCGYYVDHPGEFDTPANYCFLKKPRDPCMNCGSLALLRCSHCEHNFCFNDFVINYHCHYEEYAE